MGGPPSDRVVAVLNPEHRRDQPLRSALQIAQVAARDPERTGRAQTGAGRRAQYLLNTFE